MSYWMHKNRDLQLNQYSSKYWYSFGLSIVSIVVALILFPPLDHTFRHFPLDFVLGAAWFAAFALLVVEFKGTSCTQGFSQEGQIALGGLCNEKRAAWGFAFLTGCFFIAGSVLGLWVYLRERSLKKRNTVSYRDDRTRSH